MNPISDEGLEELLCQPDSELLDIGFSARVIGKLPRRLATQKRSTQWTLVVSFIVSSALTTATASRLENVFSTLAYGGSELAPIFAMLLLALIVIPTMWAIDLR